MSLCIASAGKLVALAVTSFTLSWTHSVEKTVWQEDWSIVANKLVLSQARVKGSGAGMDPGDGAVLEDGWWAWNPHLSPLASLVLASSGATVSAWQLCPKNPEQPCRELGIHSGEAITIKYCD